MSVTSPPVFTDFVNQQYFIEPQGGAQPPINYLARFPDNLYTKAIDSVLITLLYALMGPVGVGLLIQEYLEARLEFEDAGLSTSSLDSLYTSPFAFARLAEETYDIDAQSSLLPAAQRAQILASDADFRNRCIDFLKGIRAGGTIKGLTLVAKSGLDRPVDVIENFRALYDNYSDAPLGLAYMGTTANLNEVIVIPRQVVPESAEQTLILNGEPYSGWFTLTLPLGPPYQVIQVGLANGSNVATVPDSTQIPPGTYVSITSVPASTPDIGNAAPAIYAAAGYPLTPTSINLVYPPTSSDAGQAFDMTAATGTYWAYIGNAETVPLPYNASAIDIQTALQSLHVVDGNNVTCSGGPLPDQPVVVQFTNALSDQSIPELQPNLYPEGAFINGIGPPSSSVPLVSQMTDVTNSPLDISATITVDVPGVSADTQTTAIDPADEHAMQIALDEIRPQTCFVTTQSGRGTTQRQSAATIFSGASYTEVIRYETGNQGVPWPTIDNLHWIENGVEHEASRPVGDTKQQYQGFHNISSIIAYTEAALVDSHYGSPITPLWQTYWDTKVGQFSPAQIALYPFLANPNPQAQYSASQAVAPSPDPLVITDTVGGTGVINGNYPTDYMGLPGVPQLPTQQVFWASSERTPVIDDEPTADYLEIDLGTVQAVNYIYFEASNKPYTISVAYDVLDQSPARKFVPVKILPPALGKSVTQLVYNATATNPWSVVEIHCANGLGEMIFTRYIRIGFTRAPGDSPFASAIGPAIPYSIEVRNLRIGRNVTITLGSSTHVANAGAFDNINPNPPPLPTPRSGSCTPAWALYPNDPSNPTASPFTAIGRSMTWASNGVWSLHLLVTDTTHQHDFAPINPATWTGSGNAAPNGWWPVTASDTYSFVIDALGVSNSDFTADAGGVSLGIDWFDSSFTFISTSVGGQDSLSPHVEDGVVVTGITVSDVAPVNAAWAIPYISFYPAGTTEEAYFDNASGSFAVVDPSFETTLGGILQALGIGPQTITENIPVNITVVADGATSWGATGLPTGLSINTTTGQVTGTPTAVGSFASTITVSNSCGTTSYPLDWTVVDPLFDEIIFIGNSSSPNGPADIYTIKPDGSDLTRIPATGIGFGGGPNWFYAISNPAGSKLLAMQERGGMTFYLFTMNPDGSDVSLITNIPTTGPYAFPARVPTFSPDGTQFVLPYGDISNGAPIGACIVNTDNSGYTLVPIPEIGSGNTNDMIYWSPDGTKFAFPDTTAASGFGVSTCKIDGSDVTPLFEGASDWYDVFGWYSDSTNLLIQAMGTTGDFPITIEKSDGTSTTVLYTDATEADFFGYIMALSPDNTKIVFFDHGVVLPGFNPGLSMLSGGVITPFYSGPPYPVGGVNTSGGIYSVQWIAGTA